MIVHGDENGAQESFAIAAAVLLIKNVVQSTDFSELGVRMMPLYNREMMKLGTVAAESEG